MSRVNNFITGMLFCIPGFVVSQGNPPVANIPVDPDTKLITYKEVVPQNGTKDYLFNQCISWISSYFKSPESVTSVRDKATGKIQGIGRLRIFYEDKDGNKVDGGIITYDLKLEFKDNKYRYVFSDFNLKQNSRFPIEKWMNKNDAAYNPKWDDYLYQVDTCMQSTIRSLKKGMLPVVVKEDNW